MGQKGNVALLIVIIVTILLAILTAISFFFQSKSGLWPWDLILNRPIGEKELAKRASDLKRIYPAVIKGNWEPSSFHMAKMLTEDSDRIRELGVNTVSVSVEYSIDKDATPLLNNESQLISNIAKAKEKGFAVLVAPNFVGASGHNFKEEGINITRDEYLKISEEIALKWAEFAEKYKVEFFAPQNEFNGMIGANFTQNDAEVAQITSDWHRRVLPKIKEVYSGKLLMKLSAIQDGIDAKGYDFVGITVFHGNDNLESFRKKLSSQYQILKNTAEKSGTKWLVSEAWFAYGGPFFNQTTNRTGESLDELQDDYFEASFEEYLKLTDNPSGYIFIAWIMPGMDIKNRPAEKVIKEYFKLF